MNGDNLPYFTCLPNFALARLGCEVTAVSDEFFAPAMRMLSAESPIFIPAKFDSHGKWMDGWETRRRRQGGHDWCVVKLGVVVCARGADLDTTHFTGNYPPSASLEGCPAGDSPDDSAKWIPLISPADLRPNSHNFFAIEESRPLSHVRVNIYPDGGIARLRIFGEARPQLAAGARADLASILNGGRIIAVSDSHFGAPENMLMPGRGENMGDGWETRRRREPGGDWAILALGAAGIAQAIEVDTAHFKGNYPDRCSLQAAKIPSPGGESSLIAQSIFWRELLPPQKLRPDHRHLFEGGFSLDDPVTHIRFNIEPDGGVSRLRILAEVAA